MSSYPTADEVLADLGDKVVGALVRSVELAASDLVLYRRTFPGWVADHSERGLANWIHDRLWASLRALLHGIDDVEVVDEEPRREVWVGHRYRMRVKRHDATGGISTYPTQGALEFYIQGPTQLALEGLDEVRLTSGYDWDPDVRDLGVPVLVLRDGLDNVVWKRELSEAASGKGGLPVGFPPVPGPRTPRISGRDDAAGAQEDGTA